MITTAVCSVVVLVGIGIVSTRFTDHTGLILVGYLAARTALLGGGPFDLQGHAVRSVTREVTHWPGPEIRFIVALM
jgi:hypothetical protein